MLPVYGPEMKGFLYRLTIETRWLKRIVRVTELVGYHINIYDHIGKNISTVSNPS